MSFERLLVIGFITLTTVFSIIIGVLGVAVHKNQVDLGRAMEVRYESYVRADELRQSSDDLTRLARTYVVTGDPAYEDQYWNVLKIRNGELPRPEHYERIYWDFVAADGKKPRADGEPIPLQKLMENLGFTEEEFAKLKEAQRNSDALVWTETVAMNAVKGKFYDEQSKSFSKEDKPDFELARKLMHDNAYHLEKAKIMRPVDEFFAKLDARTKSQQERMFQRSEVTLFALLFFVVGFILSSVVGLILILRRFGWVNRVLGLHMKELADGNLRASIPLETADKMGSVAMALNVTVKSLGDILKRLTDNLSFFKSSVENLTNQVDSANDAVKRQREETANVVVAIQEVTETLGNMNRESAAAAQAARDADQVAKQGVLAIDEITRAIKAVSQEFEKASGVIDRLNAESSSIGGILDVIRNIAEQTNLLALNAAIEAARAGETGRGFAVVADEVRSLAQKSHDATQEIEAMIARLQRGAEEAVLVMESGKTEAERNVDRAAHAVSSLQAITHTVESICVMSEHLHDAVDKVGMTIANIQQRINNINVLADTSATNTRQANKASESLATLTHDLVQDVRYFKT